MSPVVPFLPTIAKQLGFSTVVVGIVYTILPFIALVMKPLSGIISDKYDNNRSCTFEFMCTIEIFRKRVHCFRFQMHKTLFLSFQVLGIVSLLGINFIEPLQHSAELGLHSSTAELRYCPGVDKLDSCAYSEIMALQPVTNNVIMSCLVCLLYKCIWSDSDGAQTKPERTSSPLIAKLSQQQSGAHAAILRHPAG